MDMLHIHNEFIQSAHATKNKEVTLRDGQIVRGKIMKLYPNQRAEIQLGTHRLFAEIMTPLSVGKQYIFQVQANDSIVQLKVLSEQLQQNDEINIKLLLQQLGLKENKWNNLLVRQLLQEKIPFQRMNLQNAAHLLGENKASQASIDILKTIIISRLPMTNNVYQALLATKEQPVTMMMQQMSEALLTAPSLTKNEQNLLEILNHLTKEPKSFHHEMLSFIRDPQTNIATLFQAILHKPMNNNRQTLQAERSQQLLNTLQIALSEGLKNAERQSFDQQMRAMFTYLGEQKHAVQNAITKLVQIFSSLQTGDVPEEQFVLLKHMVEQQVLPKLPPMIQQSTHALLQSNNAESVQVLQQLFQVLSGQGLYNEIQQLIQHQLHSEVEGQPIQQQFLNLIQHFSQMFGMHDEAHIMSHIVQNEELTNPTLQLQLQSVKSILLHMLQESNVFGNDKVQQFIHFINGMQIQSIQESNQFIHAAIQLPGEKLGLNNDLFMRFEGKKQEEGKIDPDYCRILFVLNLANLKETMIDMHVQKRIVSVAIYNEQIDLTKTIHKLEQSLAENLQQKEYTLSSVTYKRLYEAELALDIDNNEHQHTDVEGIDFRI